MADITVTSDVDTFMQAANAAAMRSALGLGSLATQASSSVSISGGTIVGLTGFGIRSTGAAFDLTFATSEALSAGRTLSFNVGDANRTLTIPATGTVALLGTTNLFTVNQVFSSAAYPNNSTSVGNQQIYFYDNGVGRTLEITANTIAPGSCVIALGNLGRLTFQSTTRTDSGTADLIVMRKAAATLQMGIDAAGVTNQMFTAANRITSDGVGANLTLAPGNGRGAAGGSLILATYDTQGAATIGNLQTRLTIDTTGLATFTSAANTGVIAATGYSLTGSNATNMIDLAGTWNTTGTPTAIKLNITNTASNAASKWLDLQSSGTSIFGIAYTTGTGGALGTTINVVNSAGTALTLFDGAVGRARFAHDFTGSVWLGGASTDVYIGANIGSAVVQTGFQGSAIFWCNTLRIGPGSTDTVLVRKAAATLQLGQDAAGVTNQMFTAANRITSDGVGANLTIAPGNGRGGAGGDLIFSHWTTGGAGVIGTLTTSMTINSTGISAVSPVTIAPSSAATCLTLTGGTVTTSKPLISATQTWNAGGTTFTGLLLNVTNTASSASSSLLTLQVGGASMFEFRRTDNYWGTPSIYTSGTGISFQNASSQFNVTCGGAFVSATATGVPLNIGTTTTQINLVTNAAGAVTGVNFFITASNVLQQRNTTNAQTYQLYGTYTDASNYTRLSLAATSTTMTIACQTAGTGADDIDLTLTPAGTGVVQFGTHSAIAAETVTGYITVKDSGGTTRKLAVVS